MVAHLECPDTSIPPDHILPLSREELDVAAAVSRDYRFVTGVLRTFGGVASRLLIQGGSW